MAKSKPKCREKTILLYIYDTSLSEVPFGGHFGPLGGHFWAKKGQILPVKQPISYQNLSGGLRLARFVLSKTHSIKVITLSPSRMALALTAGSGCMYTTTLTDYYY